MPIDAHDNPELRGTVPERGALAAGSSNSNSHNASGGGEVRPPEMVEILNQLRALLPRLQQVADRGPGS